MLSYFIPALQSVLTVVATASIGAYARFRGVLDDSGVKMLEKLVAEVFTPALVLLKVLPNVSMKSLAAIWPMALNCVLVVAFGFISGRRVCQYLQQHHPDAFPQLTGLVSVSIAFPNSFAVPLTLFLSLANHPALMRWPDTSSSMVADRGSSLFLFSYVLWIAARWSIGFPVLTGQCQSCATWVRLVLNPPVVALLVALPVGAVASQLHLTGTAVAMSPAYYVRAWLAPITSAVELSSRCLVPCTLFTLGAQLASVVQLSLRRPELEFELADDHALATAADEAPSSGGGAREHAIHASSGSPRHVSPPALPRSGYVAILVLRQVCGPLIGLCLALLLRSSGALVDPVAMMVMMLQSAGPPMINLAVMAGLAGGADASRACALVLAVTYAASLLTWTGSIAMFLAAVA